MANEIWHSYEEGLTLYALIWNNADDTIWDVVASAWDTYTDADIDDYDLVLTNQVDSDYYSVDFPSGIAAGIYHVQIMRQIGGAIDADADVAVAQGVMYWDGSAEITLVTINSNVGQVHVVQDESPGAAGAGVGGSGIAEGC
jgi:hypothetical protein